MEFKLNSDSAITNFHLDSEIEKEPEQGESGAPAVKC